ncbi:MAG: DUF454 family protein [Gammaproteobacteria bacterium]|nr:DUF454 family protein [Gammaproteobacteria bacterium]
MKNHKTDSVRTRNRFGGTVYIIAAAVCIVLGLIGLIIPVIPGVIFLAIAAIFLARVSTRMDRWVKSSPFMSNTQSRMDSMAELDWPDRARLSLWYAAYGLVKVGEFSARLINKLKRRKA